MDINDWIFLIAIIDVYIKKMDEAGANELVAEALALRNRVVEGSMFR